MNEHSGSDGSVQGKPKSHRSSATSVRLSAPRRIVKARHVSPQTIKDNLNPHQLLMLCQDWLPDGKRKGDWWTCPTPWRVDNNPSFGVSLTTGCWQDFSTGESGDIISLSMRLFNDTFTDTLDGFAEMLGLAGA